MELIIMICLILVLNTPPKGQVLKASWNCQEMEPHASPLGHWGYVPEEDCGSQALLPPLCSWPCSWGFALPYTITIKMRPPRH